MALLYLIVVLAVKVWIFDDAGNDIPLSEFPMQLLVTRPVVLTGAGGTHSFTPGLVIEIDAASAERNLTLQAGVVVGPREAVAAPAKRARKATDA
ncbi:hypothetical protein Hthe01_07660 [Hydrogenophilus thermoluteolus]|uniref:hypothetical protein n=1 Tax=Hydrogenophilus thermoluteolus TaxID=297 RepID=UPI0024A3D5E4|nr:hypothetical protein [Hydrogenophilus thermoluteolus]GLW60417.1 hypothetical protein Hthe01_07660 [Hydrogenophilus thermoluteolus]